MKHLRRLLFSTVLWYVVAAMWTVTLIFRVTAEKKAWLLIGITGFTLLASLACAIINHMATFDQAGIDDGYLDEIREGDKFTVEGAK